MRNPGTVWLGGALLVIGLLTLVGQVFNINFWQFCWPVGLIVVGVWVLFRPQINAPGSHTHVVLLGDYNHGRSEPLVSRDVMLGIGDAKFEFSAADVLPGETVLRFYGFIGDVELRLPEGVGLSLYSMAFVNDANWMGNKSDHFLAPFEITTPAYADMEKRVRLETYFFIASLKVKQA